MSLLDQRLGSALKTRLRLRSAVKGANSVYGGSEKRKEAHSQGVLFSEDEPCILEDYELIFSKCGWKNVVLCKDAEEALRRIEKCHPALIVTDMNKPGMSGYELAKALKAKSSTQRIPILLVSAVGLMGRENEDCGNLFCGVLLKPFYLEGILRSAEMAIVGKYTG